MKEYKMTYLKDIANISRAVKGRQYKAGTIIIGLSATRGEVGYLYEDGEVPTKWAVVEVSDEHNPFYIYNSILKFFPKFYAEWKTGINLQIDKLDYLKIGVHERNIQDSYAEMIMAMDSELQKVKKAEEIMENMKKYYLKKCFV